MKVAQIYFREQYHEVKFDHIDPLDDYKGGTVLYLNSGHTDITAIVPKEALILIK